MTKNTLRVIPLGGLGEIGQNMMAIEFGDDIVVIDAGILFADDSIPGVDFGIPDITYLKDHSHKVRAILITHGHEDHIGALPYVLSELNVPVYSSRLTHGLISVKLREHGMLEKSRLNVMDPYSPFKVGAFGVEFFRVCHSIPDAMGIALTTPLGLIIHTGDFKIDHTPADGIGTDFQALAKLVDKDVLLLFSDSTYAEVEGYTDSEQVVGEALDRVIGDAHGRVMVATFASLISRIQQVVDASQKHGRKVVVVGRSMNNNVKMALKMGYLNIPDGTVISLAKAAKLPHNEVTIIATGSQGEPTSALVRISNQEHQDIEIIDGDTVIISASPIPGNETVVADTIDNLFRQGASVVYSRIATVHVHGHASREELKLMLSLIRPKYFVPIHGEYRHLVAHASIARELGVRESDIFVLEDGDVLEVTEDTAGVVDQVEAGHVFIDGHRFWNLDSSVLAERRYLSHEGVVAVSIVINANSKKAVVPPKVLSFGFVQLEESQVLYDKTSEFVANIIEQEGISILETKQVEEKISSLVSKYLHKETRIRPTVLTSIEVI